MRLITERYPMFAGSITTYPYLGLPMSAKPKDLVEAAVAPDSDEALVVRARSGEQSAFQELVKRHYSKAVRIALGYLKNPTDAEDAAQEAFVRVHRNLDRFEGHAKFTTWFYRVVVNLSIDLMRKKKRQRLGAVDPDSHTDVLESAPRLWNNFDQANPEKRTERSELAEKMHDALAKLPEHHRSVLLLREVEQLSYEEIAEVLRIRKGTVMSRLFHARRKMQEELTRRGCNP